jgi:hypothetical protein
MASGDDVQLPDLQVIQRYSLAVRGATAPVDDVIAVLRSDLEWLTGGRRQAPRPAKVSPSVEDSAPVPEPATAAKKAANKAPTRTAPAKKAVVKRAPAKKAGTARKAPAKKAGARRA